MTLVISKVFTYDDDAATYIQAVEGASGDNQALEPAVRQAINNFVVGCKQDNIWTAIKASCILAGARTKEGAIIPLANASAVTPTLNGTAGGWNYNRKTGLQGNGTDNYINSGRNNNADPQNSKHLSCYILQANSAVGLRGYIGTQWDATGGSGLGRIDTNRLFISYLNSTTGNNNNTGGQDATGFLGASRSASNGYSVRALGNIYSNSVASNPPQNFTINVYNVSNNYTNARLAFYSIGESLDLARLDARVTTLINAFAAAIP